MSRARPRSLLLVHSVNADRANRDFTPRRMTDALHDVLDEIALEHDRLVNTLALSLGGEFLARAADLSRSLRARVFPPPRRGLTVRSQDLTERGDLSQASSALDLRPGRGRPRMSCAAGTLGQRGTRKPRCCGT